MRQTGYDLLVKQYTDVKRLSGDYIKLMNPGIMEEMSKRLGLKLSLTEQKLVDQKIFNEQMS